MLIEIFYKQALYIRCMIDYDKETIKIIEGPDKNVKFVNSCFEYSDGFRCDFKTMKTFLKSRGVTRDTKTGIYYKVDNDVRVVVIRKERF